MNVHLAKKALADALNHVERIIPSRSSNPGTNLLRIEAADDVVRLTGTNLELDIETTIAADVPTAGTHAVPAHVFAQVVRALPGDEVTMNEADSELKVTSGEYATRLQVVDPANAPRLTFPETFDGHLPASAFAESLARVRYAAAVAEYQAIFRGVKLELGAERTRAVATDGFRLAYTDIDAASGLSGDVIIPARTVDEIAKVFTDGIVDITRNDAQLSLRTPATRVNAKLMDGTFPDYRRVIPSAFPVTITLAADALREAVTRVSVMADKTANNRVDLFVKDGTLQITAEGAYGHSKEALPVMQEGSESEIVLSYNAKYLTDALTSLDGQLKMAFSGPTTPSVLGDPDDPAYVAMVVPLRTG